MILDFRGRALRRTIGFLPGYTLVCEVLPGIDAINLVGSETVGKVDDDKKSDAAPVDADVRMRRAA